ncbi:hypothetical protein DF034_01905 [Burkholderia anthina]|nr:hypothetical protein DF034_01905 [Burkholderia anthina]
MCTCRRSRTARSRRRRTWWRPAPTRRACRHGGRLGTLVAVAPACAWVAARPARPVVRAS